MVAGAAFGFRIIVLEEAGLLQQHPVQEDKIEGRCNVLEASVSSLPFTDNSFIMATAFETVYFWPDIEKSFAEVKRVLAPGGKFLIVNEDDGLSGNNEKWEKMIEGMHTYTPDELNKHLTAAGFREITIKRDETKHWLALTATK